MPAGRLPGSASTESRCAEYRHLIRGFSHVQRFGRPWVIAKFAMSLDGRLTRPPGEGMWLTGRDARAEVQRIRAECDAIITSGKTVRRDDPALTIRVPELLEGRTMPWRVVLTRNPAKLPGQARVFTDEWRERTLVCDGADLAGSLQRLATEQACCTVMLECGGRQTGAFLDAGLVDEVVVFLAPMVNGGGVPAIGGRGVASLPLVEIVYQRFGDDLMLRARVER
jgi:diaminohydroxyphosphoribosylaminopyrimidine deaminase/5-amino-6-(5-phosphoribosylamino)uracil reductase